MARYTEAVCKLCRRQGEKMLLKGDRCLTPKCAVERRSQGAGQRTGRRRKVSERGVQLKEKQKARQTYGILERQFRSHFAEAERRPGITGENLLRILELRFDNVIYRLGFADSRSQARQLVNHGHFVLSGKANNIPSTEIKAGDVIGVSEKSKSSEYFKILAKELSRKQIPSWLSVDEAMLTGRVLAEPVRSDIDSRINEQAIVEFYSR